jgi:hypothetical protein
MRQLCILLLLLGLALRAEDYAARLTPLIEPTKLSTLGRRGANPRIHKCVYWLDAARKAGQSPDKVADEAVARAGYTNASAKLTKAALLRNLDIADKLGCLNDFGLAEMRRGRAPIIQKGPYKGDEPSVDHIIPRAVVPELDNVIANLELMPLKLNESKNSKIGERQRDLAHRLHDAGMLSQAGLHAVETHGTETVAPRHNHWH